MSKVYIISEIGINHNGSFVNCYKLIDAAVNAGCDCVKFQFFKAKNLYPRKAGRLKWKSNGRHYNYDIYEATEKFELSKEWLHRLITYCRLKDIDFLSSVIDKSGLDLLMEEKIKKIKIPSTAITNIPLIEQCAKTRLPILVSTGGASLAEIEDAVLTVKKYHHKISLLHCTINYPVALKDCNLGIIETLKHAFPDVSVGFSDHTKEISDAPVQAVYLQAQIIEKHITLNRAMPGPDHFFALEPDMLKQMVRDIRQAEKDFRGGKFTINKVIYGKSEKIISAQEMYLRKFAFMTLFANRDIRKGEVIRTKYIAVLRPGNKRMGLKPKFLELFKRNKITAKKDILFEEPITWDAILQ